ncbi:MAG: hypothetical protein A3I61_17260 [Acidobacteria bacterium RIFCSPLOWO2_02_FULL_68_18]|nr:MAG: hypothetical protein A3I61_17260 [Acidobacteria bacterium RIFCSPLOWO2_02_FULL_68_18]OFW50428.1 MAG: hypothetical protein A3G77_11835 [Acidobacteria bacterium RIFCSPLOWO2_12_FULL_68_19]
MTHLSALGLLPDGWNLIPVMVDQDQQHPRITATTRFIDRYLAVRAARRATTLSGQGLFGLSISRVVGSNVLQPSTHESLFDLLGLADSRQAKAAARLLFDGSEIGVPGGRDFANGYYGRVNAGVCFFNDPKGRDSILAAIREHLLSGDGCVVLFGSGFGGTGAAGLLHIARLLRDDPQLKPVKVPIAIIQLEPYFEPDSSGNDGTGGFVNLPESFESRTGAAYEFLDNLAQAGNLPCQAIYPLGTPVPAAFPPEWFARDQQDNPHLFLEYLGALAARDFVLNHKELTDDVRIRRLPVQPYEGPLADLRTVLFRAAVSCRLLDSYFIPLLDHVDDDGVLPGHPWVHRVCATGGMTAAQLKEHFGEVRALLKEILINSGAYPHDQLLSASPSDEERERLERRVRITRESFPPDFLPLMERLSAPTLIGAGDPLALFDDYTLQGDAEVVARSLWRWVAGALALEAPGGQARAGGYQLRWQAHDRDVDNQPLQLPTTPNDEFHSAKDTKRQLTSLALGKWSERNSRRSHSEYPSAWAPAIVHRDILYSGKARDDRRYLHLGLLAIAMLQRPGSAAVPVRLLRQGQLNETFRESLSKTCPIPAYDKSVVAEGGLLVLFDTTVPLEDDGVPSEEDVIGFFYPDTVVVPAMGLSSQRRTEIERFGLYVARRGFPRQLCVRIERDWVQALRASQVPNADRQGERFLRFLANFEARTVAETLPPFYTEFPIPGVARWIRGLFEEPQRG